MESVVDFISDVVPQVKLWNNPDSVTFNLIDN